MPNVLITGSNRGIGLELVKKFLGQGNTVYAVCRNSSAGLDATGATIVPGVDVADAGTYSVLEPVLGNAKLDVVIHNAGILSVESLDNMDEAGIVRQFQVNAVAPMVLTSKLLKNLGEGSKVACITSRMGSVADNGSGGYYGYRMSKAALNAGGMSLARDLKPKGIAVALLHPGFVQTEMVGNKGDITPEEAADRLVKRIEELTLDTTGTFWHSNGEVLPW